MDMSKAFDNVEWVQLFTELRRRKVGSIYLRLLLYIYRQQTCKVKWASAYSHEFSVNNGVRQGGVSSAILFAVYIDELLTLLKNSRLGCYIDSVFVGAFIFADDILLLSASRSGLQSLVSICHEFAHIRNLKFGTNDNPTKSKTKCIEFAKKSHKSCDAAPITLDGKTLPWVKKITYLGCTLEEDNSMRTDITMKRGQFISKVNSLLQEFHYCSHETLLKLITTYTCAFYGSPLWNLRSKEAEKLFRSWNVMVRNALQIDRMTHRNLIEPLSGNLHLKPMLLSRFVKFYKGLISSPKFTVRFLARISERDMRTVLGRTLDYLTSECELERGKVESLTPLLVKRKVVYAPLPPESMWKFQLAKEVISVRDKNQVIVGFTDDELNEILTFTCTE